MCAAGQLEKQHQQLFDQFSGLLDANRPERPIRWATGQAEGQLSRCAGQGAEPDVVRVFEHRQGFAAVHLNGEFGRQPMQRRGVLQQSEQRGGQRPGVEQGLRVEAGGGAEQQVAHIVGGRVARAEIGGQQALDQLGLLAGQYAANLQVAAVGQLQHTAGAALGRLCDGACLLAAEYAAGQLDPADTAIQRLNDTQQAGARARAWVGQVGGGWTVAQQVHQQQRT